MKKMIALALALVMMALCLTACGGSKVESDLEFIQDKGVLVVGVEDFLLDRDSLS